MNLSLVDPFILAQDIPDALTNQIRSGHSTALRFNRKGDLLASGRVDGALVVFDVETQGVACKLRGHTRQIQSLSWSHDGRYLLSSGQDCKSILWDLSTSEQLRSVRFEAPVYIAELHPTNHSLFVAALFDDAPVLVDIKSTIPVKLEIPTTPKRTPGQNDEYTEKQSLQDAKQATSVTIFNAVGTHIITGTSRGWINVIDVQLRQVVFSTRVCASVILLLRLSASGRDLVCNATDRIVRTLHLNDLGSDDANINGISIDVEHKFQDVVQRLSWNHSTFSSTGEYVAATTYMNHDIYIWERGHGSLVKILECTHEELGIVEWHPQRPVIAACGLESGKIYLWSIETPQRWSALAPDFVEVEENVEYLEREDEFDIHPVEEIHKRRLDMEDEVVDVLTMGAAKSAVDDEAFSLPVLFDAADSESEDEMVNIGRGVMRRRDPGEGKEWMQDSSKIGDGPTSKALPSATKKGRKIVDEKIKLGSTGKR